jgi:hypothetical protein
VAGEGAGAVAFGGEEVFAGPEGRFGPLADRRELRRCSALLRAARARERGVPCGDRGREAAAGVAAVAEQDLAAVALAAVRQDPSAAKIAGDPNPQKRPERDAHHT